MNKVCQEIDKIYTFLTGLYNEYQEALDPYDKGRLIDLRNKMNVAWIAFENNPANLIKKQIEEIILKDVEPVILKYENSLAEFVGLKNVDDLFGVGEIRVSFDHLDQQTRGRIVSSSRLFIKVYYDYDKRDIVTKISGEGLIKSIKEKIIDRLKEINTILKK